MITEPDFIRFGLWVCKPEVIQLNLNIPTPDFSTINTLIINQNHGEICSFALLSFACEVGFVFCNSHNPPLQGQTLHHPWWRHHPSRGLHSSGISDGFGRGLHSSGDMIYGFAIHRRLNHHFSLLMNTLIMLASLGGFFFPSVTVSLPLIGSPAFQPFYCQQQIHSSACASWSWRGQWGCGCRLLCDDWWIKDVLGGKRN